MRLFIAYAATLVALLILDFAWLGTVGGGLFKKTLGDVLAPTVSITPAIVFYLLYVVGILIFVVLPALDGAWSWSAILGRGALFGFFAYLTYDVTNLATLRNYTIPLAATDLAWGTVVTAVSATVGAMVAQRFG